ncbi:MAG: Cof-type HAD-IIB family hydrolase [Atopobiaceae bacterium]|nr:Cof-type HAD-IIB family hydrolase [Atopobiaceae bacterium]
MVTWETPRPIRAAFFDADGTLLSFATHEVPDSARRAIEELCRRGVRCFLCTGRSPSLLDDVPLELFDACLTMSGQYCYAGDEVFVCKPIDRADMEVVVSQVRQGLYHCLFMEPHRSYLSGYDELVNRAVADANLSLSVEDVEQALTSDVIQLNIFIPAEREDVVLSKTHNLRLTRWSPNFADAMPADGGKAEGVRAALKRYGLDADEAVAFGDGGNDADMFAAVGTSIAMGNAAAIVQELTTYVTDDVDHDGIWNACVRLGLIGS